MVHHVNFALLASISLPRHPLHVSSALVVVAQMELALGSFLVVLPVPLANILS
jgi:hypothetical protein